VPKAANPGKKPKTFSGRQVDSLNELAFQVKRHDIQQALTLLDHASTSAKRQQYKKGEATAYLYQAGIYQQYGFDRKALMYYYQALKISELIQDTFNIARANQQIGNALMANKKFGQAQQLFRQALKNYTLLDRQDDVTNVKNSLGLISLEQRNWGAAKRYFTAALKASKAMKYGYGYKKSNYHLGLLYLRINQLPMAKAYFRKALALDEQANDKYGLALAKNNLSAIAFRQGQAQEAIRLATEAWQDAAVISATQLSLEAAGNLVAVYRQLHQYEKVIAWQQVLIEQQKKLSEQEHTYALNFLDILKEHQEKQYASEKQVLLAQNKARLTNIILFLSALALVGVTFLAFILHKNYKRVKAYSKELRTSKEVIARDAAALEQLNQAISRQNGSLEESNQLKNKLMSILSHDLRTPLANTQGLLKVINAGKLSAEGAKPLLLELENQYTRSLTLLDNLLFWIKSQLTGKGISISKTSLTALLESVIEEQQVLIRKKEIEVRNQVDPAIMVEGDREMLKVIFRNLLSNSLKFTRPGAKVILDACVDQDVRIQIQDEGVGMSSEDIAKIKSRSFFSTTGTHKETGSGIGLMICQDLVNRHGGTLHIASAPQQGATFTIRLPYSQTWQEAPMVHA
jgi:signal transduction histidine kinase